MFDFYAWWDSLEEGRRNILIDDKWMLVDAVAKAAFDAGKEAGALEKEEAHED